MLIPVLPIMADNIVVYGASGKIGDIIVTAALSRRHNVIGVSRNPDGLKNEPPNFSAIAGDVPNLD
jgi:putative NADH-flavin reductase